MANQPVWRTRSETWNIPAHHCCHQHCPRRCHYFVSSWIWKPAESHTWQMSRLSQLSFLQTPLRRLARVRMILCVDSLGYDISWNSSQSIYFLRSSITTVLLSWNSAIIQYSQLESLRNSVYQNTLAYSLFISYSTTVTGICLWMYKMFAVFEHDEKQSAKQIHIPVISDAVIDVWNMICK